MSHYLNIKTKMSDPKALLLALQRMTLRGTGKCATLKQIEFHEKATNLYGFHADKREDVANVIIRRNFVGPSSNDIGFVRESNGNYRAIISEFDRSNHYNAQWVQQLIMYYGVEKAKMECAKRKISFKEFVDPNDPQKRPRLLANFA